MAERSGYPIENVLRRLRSADAGPAWVEFLDRYAQLIMNVAAQIEFEQDRIEDCFLYVCEKLNEDGFRRLLKFNTAGKARFGTWLSTVVFNLCVDWHRGEYGRVRLLPAIAALPEFDQAVYRLVIEQGVTRESCFHELQTEYPDLTRQVVTNALERIHTVLTPRQRWQISVKRRIRTRSGELQADENDTPLSCAVPGPEIEAQQQQSDEIMRSALSRLRNDQRLLLYWRYQEGLSLEKIAELAHLGSINTAWRHVQEAVRALTGQVQDIQKSGSNSIQSTPRRVLRCVTPSTKASGCGAVT